MAKVFVGYAAQDRGDCQRVVKYSRMLGPGVQLWSDDQIDVGQRWTVAIDDALRTCDVAIVLVSDHFMQSKFIRDTEMPALLARQERGEVDILPIFLTAPPRPAFSFRAAEWRQMVRGGVFLWTEWRRMVRGGVFLWTERRRMVRGGIFLGAEWRRMVRGGIFFGTERRRMVRGGIFFGTERLWMVGGGGPGRVPGAGAVLGESGA